MIIDPLKRFSKNELNKQGQKLAFLDTSVMKPDKLTEELVNHFYRRGIRPVVNNLSLTELIKGLNPASSIIKKMSMARNQSCVFESIINCVIYIPYYK